MAGENRIILKIEGSEKNQHRLSLSTFVEKIKRFQALLQCSADEAAGELGKKVQFELGTIKRASPITLEAVPAPDTNKDAAIATLAYISKNLDLVTQGNAASVSPQWCRALDDVARYNSNEFSLTEIKTTNGASSERQSYLLDAQFRKKLSIPSILGDVCISTVDGRLEQINIHGKGTFRIYPVLPVASAVTCKFDGRHWWEKVRDALGKFVSVRGECHYRPGEAFPHEIQVQDMEVLPPSDELPTWKDIYGIAPNITGGLSAEEFVRRQRDKWNS